MDIYPLGHSSFRIKGKTVTVVTDPFDPAAVGFPFPKHIACDIVTVSHDHADHNNTQILEGNPFIVSGPGEYEVKGVGIIGVPSYHDGQKGAERGNNTMYQMEIDGLHLAHLGDLGSPLNADAIDKLDGVDILFVPVGGSVTIDPNQAATVISELEPSIVIPMHYKTDRHNATAFGELSTLSQFLTVMGAVDTAAVPKLSMTKDKLPSQMQIVVLE